MGNGSFGSTARLRGVLLAGLVTLLAVGPRASERAGRYPAAGRAKIQAPGPDDRKAGPPPHWARLPVEPRPDVPLEFVPAAEKEWAALPGFWNPFPPPAAGMRTAHLGLPPLSAVAAMALADAQQVIKIKVPLGLPDPRPLIPAANPPTHGRWKLGKKVFFERVLQAGGDYYACATCHRPEHGFAQPRPRPIDGVRNTSGLINVVFNRHQFWDGRAQYLEEVIVASLDDERPADASPPGRERPQVTHRWGGLVQSLDKNEAYRAEFRQVFGIAKPTQDAIAKAVATYMRTILSGDAVFDRAEAERQRKGAQALTADHFLAVLDDAAVKRLGGEKLTKAEAGRLLARGAEVFHGRAGCAACHRGPLFTDHDFHNIGFGDPDVGPPGQETGRFARVPVGLKETRLIGAHRTPSLRALPRTNPYFHHGKGSTLRQVVQFYNRGIEPSPALALPLRAGDMEQVLNLEVEEIDALVLFLQSLDGSPVDPVVSGATKQ